MMQSLKNILNPIDSRKIMLKEILVIVLFTVGLQANSSRDDVLLKLVKDSQKDKKMIGQLQREVDRSENRITKKGE